MWKNTSFSYTIWSNLDLWKGLEAIFYIFPDNDIEYVKEKEFAAIQIVLSLKNLPYIPFFSFTR